MFIISMYFFFNDTATPEIYTYGHTLSLHDALPIFPLAGLRWLRVLRVGTLLIRLQRLGLIDMRGWAIYGLFSRYYYLLIEELSDRVMVRLFGRLQQEIGASDDLSRRLLQEVVRPRKQRLRSEERRVGKECVRPFRSRWSPDH